jgi:outer membrane protein TolC
MAVRSPSLLLAVSTAALLAGCAVSPVPLSPDDLAIAAADHAGRVAGDQEPVSGSIGLYEAMARALKYNLDHHVEIVQTALRVSELDLTHYNMLPNAVSNSGYAARDTFSASSSLNLVTGVENFGASTSQEKKIGTNDITFSWSILDFGLSYVRARQAGDKVLIAEESRRKAAHRLIEDVRTAYWRAISAEKLMGKLRALEMRTLSALSNSRAISAGGEISPIAALTYERELIEIKRTLQELQRDLSIAKSQLSALMNLTPGTRFSLVSPSRRLEAPDLKAPVTQMIDFALQNRSELRENAYQQRINAQEAHAALLELLPGFQLYAGTNFDSNDFLLNNNWLSWGTKASWNVLKVFSYPAKSDVIEMQDKLLDQRALALTMAIMTQVHISRVRYMNYQKELKTSVEYADVQRRLVEQIRVEAAGDRVSEQTLIREELNTLVAQAKQDIAFANCQNSYANVFAAVGLDPYPDSTAVDLNIADLAANLKQLWFERGDYPAGAKLASAH